MLSAYARTNDLTVTDLEDVGGGSLRELGQQQPAGVVAAQLDPDPGRGARVVKRTDRTADLDVQIGDDGSAELEPRGLIRATPDLDGVHFGRDLFGWGSFEDVEADGQAAGGIHWATTEPDAANVRSVEEAPSGHRFLEVTNRHDSGNDVLVRPVARITPSEHRLYTKAGSPPTARRPTR